MNVDSFRRWCATAPVNLRVEAAHGFVRFWRSLEADHPKRPVVRQSVLCCLDDPAIAVREAIALAMAGEPDVPRPILMRLIADVPSVSSVIFARSAAVRSSHLLSGLERDEPQISCAIASRPDLPVAVVNRVLNDGNVEACIALAQNSTIDLSAEQVRIVINRLAGVPDQVAFFLESRNVSVSQKCLAVLAHAKALQANQLVGAFVKKERLAKTVRLAIDKSLLEAMADAEAEEVRQAIASLAGQNVLTPGFVIRASVCGRIEVLEATVGCLARVPVGRVRSAIVNPRPAVAAALLKRTGLSKGVTEIVSLALILARELANMAVTWDDQAFAEAMDEMLADHDAELIGEAALGLCDEILAEFDGASIGNQTLFDDLDFDRLFGDDTAQAGWETPLLPVLNGEREAA